jgi:hypothetical protein
VHSCNSVAQSWHHMSDPRCGRQAAASS